MATYQDRYSPKEPLRTQQLTRFINFTEDIDRFKVVGYLVGNRVDKCKSLTVYNFDTIQRIKQSTNPIQKGEYTQALGYRIKEGITHVLILKKR
jgi:hypothetical protein